MRGKSKKTKNTRKPRRDLKDIENIKRISSTPRQNYMSDQYATPSPPSRPSGPRRSTTTKKRPRTAQSPELHKRTNRRKVKKKKTNFFIGRILFLFSFIIGVIYIISIVVDTAQKPVISYQMVQRGIIDKSDIFHGLIVRNEKIIPNASEGNMYLLAAEGDKVKKNGMVYQILDSMESTILERNIQNVESDIEKIQIKRQDISYYQNEIKEINNNIDNYIEVYHTQSKPGKLDQTHELKKQIEYELLKRKNIHMKDKTVALNELQDQKLDLSSQLTGKEKIFRSDQPGIVSYYTDGFEDKFTLENIDEISQKDIKQKYTYKSTTENQIIQQGEPAYRLIKDNGWKMVSFIPADWAERLPKGQRHDFVLLENSNTEFRLKVEENIPQGKIHKVIFSSNEQLDVFSDKRTASFKSLQYIHEGLKIPQSAIAQRNLIKIPSEYTVNSEGNTGIMKALEGAEGNVFQPLNVQYEDDNGYTHILQNLGQRGELKLGDVIIHPSKANQSHVVSEVSTVEGVYVVNGRITKFKPIHIMAQKEEYVIVNPNSINGLKQFDQIVTNPKNIEEEQLLRNMDVKNIK